MDRLDRNTRYSGPTDMPLYKLGPGDSTVVTLGGWQKGCIRVGQKAYSCIWLPAVNAPGFVYCNKGGFLDLVKFVEEKLDGNMLRPFTLTYQAGAGLSFLPFATVVLPNLLPSQFRQNSFTRAGPVRA